VAVTTYLTIPYALCVQAGRFFTGVPNLKPFRALRLVKALRTSEHLKYYDTILEALEYSVQSVGNVVQLTAFVMLIFAILSLQMFAGCMNFHCVLKNAPGSNQTKQVLMEPHRYCDGDLYNSISLYRHSAFIPTGETGGFMCPRGTECARDTRPISVWTSFDNIGVAMFTIFQITTAFNWGDILFMLQDSYDDVIPWVFMMLVVFCFGFLVLNMYTSSIVMAFKHLRMSKEAFEAAEAKRLWEEQNQSKLSIEQALEIYATLEDSSDDDCPKQAEEGSQDEISPDIAEEESLQGQVPSMGTVYALPVSRATIHVTATHDYSSFSLVELREELKKRGQDTRGIRSKLVKRLKDLDAPVPDSVRTYMTQSCGVTATSQSEIETEQLMGEGVDEDVDEILSLSSAGKYAPAKDSAIDTAIAMKWETPRSQRAKAPDESEKQVMREALQKRVKKSLPDVSETEGENEEHAGEENEGEENEEEVLESERMLMPDADEMAAMRATVAMRAQHPSSYRRHEAAAKNGQQESVAGSSSRSNWDEESATLGVESDAYRDGLEEEELVEDEHGLQQAIDSARAAEGEACSDAGSHCGSGSGANASPDGRALVPVEESDGALLEFNEHDREQVEVEIELEEQPVPGAFTSPQEDPEKKKKKKKKEKKKKDPYAIKLEGGTIMKEESDEEEDEEDFEAQLDEVEMSSFEKEQARKRMIRANRSLSPEGFTWKFIAKELGGETTQMWRRRIKNEFAEAFPSAGLVGDALLRAFMFIWRRNDPEPDAIDPDYLHMPLLFKNPVGEFIAGRTFEIIVNSAISINVVCMMMVSDGMSDGFHQGLETVEMVFSFLFVLEMLLRWFAYEGLVWYFGYPASVFDAFLVITSLPTTISYFASSTAGILNLSFFRSFRLLRIFRLLRNMGDLLDTIASAFVGSMNVAVFISFSSAIFSIFAMKIFSLRLVDENGGIPRANFDTFFEALVTSFQIVCGDRWMSVLHSVLRCAPEPDLYNGVRGSTPCTGQRPFWELLVALVFMLAYFILFVQIFNGIFCAIIIEDFELKTQEKADMQILVYTQKLQQAKMEAKKARGVNRYDLYDSVQKQEEDALREQQSLMQGLPQRMKSYLKKNTDALFTDNSVVERNLEEKAISSERDPSQEKKLVSEVKEEQELEYAEFSCRCLTEKMPVRKRVMGIVKSWQMEYTVLISILYSCVLLTIDTPYQRDKIIRLVVQISDPFMLCVFTFEMVCKIMAFGFYGAKDAYLHSFWNQLDFFCVVMSYVAMFGDFAGSYGRLLRTGRAIRPLRMINKSESMQLIFEALAKVFPVIGYVMVLAMFTTALFAVLGLHFFHGLLYRCNKADATGRLDCVGHAQTGLGFPTPLVWDNPGYSFDNMWDSSQITFESLISGGWQDVMYSTMDITGKDKQPKQDASPYYVFYFMMSILISAMFVLKMVVGAIVEKFNQMTGRGILNEEQRMQKELLLYIVTNSFDSDDPPSNCFRKSAYSVTSHKYFEPVFMFLLVVNTVFMGLEYYGQPDDWSKMLKTVDDFFIVSFTVELVLRVVAEGWEFFKKPMNRYDFGVVMVTNLFAIIGWEGLPVKALRFIRLVKFLRLKKLRRLKVVFVTAAKVLPAFLNLLMLLLMLIFIWALAGMQLFANVRFGKGINSHTNFRYFGSSMKLMSVTLTGENWRELMKDTMVAPPFCTPYERFVDGYYLPNDCGMGGAISMVYFMGFYILGVFIVMHLLIALLIDNFSFREDLAHPQITEQVLENFTTRWYAVTRHEWDMNHQRGRYMKMHCIRDFICSLKRPLGIDGWSDQDRRRYRFIMEECRLKSTWKKKAPSNSWSAALGLDGIMGSTQQGEFQGIGMKQMILILVSYALGLQPLSYEDQLDRKRELAEIAMLRVTSMVTAAARGLSTRTRLKEKAADKARRRALGAVEANDFISRFANVMQDEREQEKLGITDATMHVVEQGQGQGLGDQLFELEDSDEDAEEVVAQEARKSSRGPSEEALEAMRLQQEQEAQEQVEIAAANSKFAGAFAERARKRKELRTKRTAVRRKEAAPGEGLDSIYE